MEFVILRDAEVSFSGPSTSEEEGLLGRISASPLEAEILATKDDSNGTNNQHYSSQLANAIMKNPWKPISKDDKTDWTLKVAVSLPRPIRENVGRAELGEMKVSSTLNYTNNFLSIIHYAFNEQYGNRHNVTLNVLVKNFGVKNKSSNSPSGVDWKAKDLILQKAKKNHALFIECNYKPPVSFKGAMLEAWENGQAFCGTFTISVKLSSFALSVLDLKKLDPWNEIFEHLEIMLKAQMYTDMEILAGVPPNQKVIKCHRAMLATGSSVFQMKFESGMKEATGKKIEIEDMSEDGVRAMLAYLYYRDCEAAYESSKVALELLHAGEKYEIQGLKESVREYMMAKEADWFGVDMVVTLYMFVRALCPKEDEEIKDLEDDEDIEMKSNQSDKEEKEEEIGAWKSLKEKCLKVLRWYTKMKPKTLLESVKYQEIYGGGNLKLGMEINSGMQRLD